MYYIIVSRICIFLDHIREILKVTTGRTEYGGVIDKLGRIIMRDELHGKRTYL